MIKKIVLAFLLLFFSSVSFAYIDRYFNYDQKDKALLACNNFISSLSPVQGRYYSCYERSASFAYYAYSFDSLYPNHTFYANDLGMFSYKCGSGSSPTDYYFHTVANDDNTSCVVSPVCTSPQILNSDKNACIAKSECLLPFYVVNQQQTACITVPNCTAPKVLNSDLNDCVDPPTSGYKKWVKNKSLGVELCNSDSVDSKFLALTPDPYPGMIMCTEESTRVTLRIGTSASSATIINEYSICEFPKKITDVSSGGYINSCSDAPADGDKTSCPTGQILYKGNCYNVTNSTTGSTTSGSTTSGDTGTGSTSGSTTSGDTSGSTTSGSTTSGDTGTGSTSGSTTSGDTSGSSSGDASFTCSDGSVISPPLDCPKQYCGYLNGVYACYESVGSSTSSGGSTSTGSTSGDTSTTSGGSTSTGSTSGDTSTTSGGSTSTGSTSGDTSTTSGGSTSTGSTSGDTSTTSGGSTSTGSSSDGSTTSGDTSGSTTSGSTTSGSTTSGDTSGSTSGSTTSGSSSGDTSTGSGSGSGTSSGDDGTSGSGSGDCSTLEGAVNCLKGTGDKKSFTKGTDGKFGDEADDALQDAKNALDAKVAQVKSKIKDFLPKLGSDSSGGSCDLPVFSLGTIKGVQVERDLNDWCSELSVLSTVFLALASVIAFGIVFGGGK